MDQDPATGEKPAGGGDVGGLGDTVVAGGGRTNVQGVEGAQVQILWS